MLFRVRKFIAGLKIVSFLPLLKTNGILLFYSGFIFLDLLHIAFNFTHIFLDLSVILTIRVGPDKGFFYDLVLLIAIYWNLKEKYLTLYEKLKFI